MSLVYINNCTPHRPGGSSCSWFPVWQKTSLVRYRVYNDISPSFSTRINSYEFHWMGNIDRNWINLAPTSLAINLCHKKVLALTHTVECLSIGERFYCYGTLPVADNSDVQVCYLIKIHSRVNITHFNIGLIYDTSKSWFVKAKEQLVHIFEKKKKFCKIWLSNSCIAHYTIQL